MRLIIGRHGKAAHNAAFESYQNGNRAALPGLPGLRQDDAPLVESGIRQARAAGAYLVEQDLVPEVVYVSPTVRTHRTWTEYGLAHLTAIPEPRLKEQDGGSFDRLPLAATHEQRRAYTLEALRNPDARPPGGESIREHLQRVAVWLSEVMERHPTSTVLAVTHYGSIGLLGMLCEGLGVEQYLTNRPQHLTPGCGDLIGYSRRNGRWRRVFVFDNPYH